jgi:hypothetical protein
LKIFIEIAKPGDVGENPYAVFERAGGGKVPSAEDTFVEWLHLHENTA